MDEKSYDDGPIKPMFCPRCGEKVIFKEDDGIECPVCGDLYYDMWLGIWRINRHEVKEE